MQGAGPPNPYRPHGEPRPQTELERLAAEGRRMHERSASRDAHATERESEERFALALGGHYGTPFLRTARLVQYTSLVVLPVTIVALVLGLAPEIASPVIGISALVAFVLVFVRLFTPPRASRRQCDAEIAWASSLPFALTGYLETLGTEPEIYRVLDVVFEYSGAAQPPGSTIVLGVIQRLDPQAERMTTAGREASFRTSRIDGSTGIMINRQLVLRNHRIVKYVHDLVTMVAMPIHAECPIARVSITIV